MTLGRVLNMEGVLGVIMIVVGFFVWFCLSMLSLQRHGHKMDTDKFIAIAILVCMEGISAMLHSLRLAWVESFSKFVEFGGWSFAPISFNNLLEESEELKDYLR